MNNPNSAEGTRARRWMNNTNSVEGTRARRRMNNTNSVEGTRARRCVPPKTTGEEAERNNSLIPCILTYLVHPHNTLDTCRKRSEVSRCMK